MKTYGIPLSILIVALHAASCSTEQDTNTAGIPSGTSQAIDALFAAWDKPGSPGCAIGVAQDGEIILARGYGYANLDYDIPITSRTVFDIASITKQFVAASINILALEGKLSLDDDIREWLPELPVYEKPIRLRHMLYHTSGLRDYLTLFPLAGRDDYYPISHAQILAMMSRQRALNFLPGERYLYSNTAYMLLAQLIERASGQSLGEFVEASIFAPVGMPRSLMYDDFEAVIPQRAIGYIRDDDRVRMVHNYNFDVPGDGQMYTTVEDLLRWDAYLFGDEKPAYHASMLTPGLLNNGEQLDRAQGLFLGEYRGMSTIYHTGSSWGFREVLMRFAETGLAVAIACNDGNSNPYDIALQVADQLLADRLDPEIAVVADELDAEKATQDGSLLAIDRLVEFAGEFYSVELDATYRLSVEQGRLMTAIEQEPSIVTNPVANDLLVFDFSPQGWWETYPARMKFDRDSAGAITGFKLSLGEVHGILFEKRP